MGIDDMCCDFHWEWIRRLWEEAVWKMKSDYEVNESFNDIPKDVQYSWRDKFWFFDTAKWTNKIDHRSLPGTLVVSEMRDFCTKCKNPAFRCVFPIIFTISFEQPTSSIFLHPSASSSKRYQEHSNSAC